MKNDSHIICKKNNIFYDLFWGENGLLVTDKMPDNANNQRRIGHGQETPLLVTFTFLFRTKKQ